MTETFAPGEFDELVAWLGEQTWSNFALSLASQAETRGLTMNQINAARAMRAKCQKGEQLKLLPDPSERIDVRRLPAGKYAVPGGDTRLKIEVEHVEDDTRWNGWTFVRDAAVYGKGRAYGNQPPGRFYKGEIKAELQAILADPKAAAAAYGRLTGTCGRCGRPLENKESVDRGIGPWCARKAWVL